MNITKIGSILRRSLTGWSRTISYLNKISGMLKRLMDRWKVSQTDLVLILCVFAITGTTTAYISKVITGWAGFTEATHWAWKLSLRLVVLVFGYQVILLVVAFLFGQFPFFWRYEKKILRRLGIMKKERNAVPAQKIKEEIQ